MYGISGTKCPHQDCTVEQTPARGPAACGQWKWHGGGWVDNLGTQPGDGKHTHKLLVLSSEMFKRRL